MLTVATLVLDELHVAVVVMFWVLLSLKVPVAVSCSVPPTFTTGLGGVIAIETSTAGVTVNVVEPLMLPELAEIVVPPVE